MAFFLFLSPPPLQPGLSPPSSFFSPLSFSLLQTSIKNMERELLCPVCKEMYKQPLVLPCMHNACHICATEVLLQQGYICPDPTSEPTSPASTPATESLSIFLLCNNVPLFPTNPGFGTYPGRKRGGALHPQSVLFPCPLCQRDVDLGERGLGSLFRNLTLERVVERYRHTINVNAAIMCQFCKPPQLEATKGCTECKSSFCNECFKLYHPWGTQKAQHEPIPPTLTFRPKGLLCPEHREEVTHYCKTCQRLVCQLCRVRRTHTSHKITPVLSAYQALKVTILEKLIFFFFPVSGSLKFNRPPNRKSACCLDSSDRPNSIMILEPNFKKTSKDLLGATCWHELYEADSEIRNLQSPMTLFPPHTFGCIIIQIVQWSTFMSWLSSITFSNHDLIRAIAGILTIEDFHAQNTRFCLSYNLCEISLEYASEFLQGSLPALFLMETGIGMFYKLTRNLKIK
uniref:Tripartite motif containing 46 n=1 Tax=Naja naja TaxID=35670 RepID=A0A8C6XHX6_NAJNA